MVVGAAKSQEDEEMILPIKLFINGGGGLSGAQYANVDSRLGGNLGLGAVYNISNSWGISVGAEAALYRSGTEANVSQQVQVNSTAYNRFPGFSAADANFIYDVNMNGYVEEYNSMFVNVPLMVRYALPLSSKDVETSDAGYVSSDVSDYGKISFSAGVKFAIPIAVQVSQSASSLFINGHSPLGTDYFASLNDNIQYLSDYGFGNRPAEEYNKTTTMKMNYGFAVAAELGYSYPLSKSVDFYGGFYCDYGIANLYKKDASPSDFVPQRDAAKSYAVTSSRISNVAAGVMIRFIFNFYSVQNTDEDD